jgi:hypothetical protein
MTRKSFVDYIWLVAAATLVFAAIALPVVLR